MSIIYVLSIVYLAVSFLIYKKNNEKKVARYWYESAIYISLFK